MEQKYLVPAPVRRGYEFAPGIGVEEVLVAGAGVVVAAVLFGLAVLLHLPLMIRAIVAVIPAGVGVGSVMLKISDLPLYKHAQFAWVWAHSQKLYLYNFKYPTDY